jgi:hypothetical protein
MLTTAPCELAYTLVIDAPPKIWHPKPKPCYKPVILANEFDNDLAVCIPSVWLSTLLQTPATPHQAPPRYPCFFA